MNKSTVETRLAALEAEVAQIKLRLAQRDQSDVPWWDKIAGTFANDPLYEEAMRLGREYRESLRPRSSQGRRARHDRS
jgi:hypothetical protein